MPISKAVTGHSSGQLPRVSVPEYLTRFSPDTYLHVTLPPDQPNTVTYREIGRAGMALIARRGIPVIPPYVVQTVIERVRQCKKADAQEANDAIIELL